MDGLLAIGLSIVTYFLCHYTYHYVLETDLKLLYNLRVYIRNVPGAVREPINILVF